MKEKEIVSIAQNKKALHDYEVIERYEAGLELKGTEIKSIREHRVNLKDSFCQIRGTVTTVHNLHISPYGHGNIFNHEPTRIRRLLLKKKEILKIDSQLSQKGYSLVPLSLYIKGKYAKLQIALVKGKKLHDKRDALREKDIKRDMDREMKHFQ